MDAALYALAGTVIGVLGSTLTDAIRGRRDEKIREHEALRTVSAEFTTLIARLRRYSFQLWANAEDEDLWKLILDTFTDARAAYERLLLTAESLSTQEAARHVIHFSFWLANSARGAPNSFRDTEKDLMSWSAKLYSELRSELGLKNPGNVYRDLPENFTPPEWASK